MRQQNYPLHLFLFFVTVFTTSMAGAELVTGRSFFSREDLPAGLELSDIWRGLVFSGCFLTFLTVHEFGHYLTAIYRGVRCSLPYYIPILIPGLPLNIGSFGAVIRIREVPPSRRIYFDIGVAGPLAGFVIALGMLIYGLLDLPPMVETVMSIHPEFQELFGRIPTTDDLANRGEIPLLGESLLTRFLMAVLPIDQAQLPPAFEMMHYPFIFVGHLTLFFTALNLLPIGQLDGGHVVYGLFGRRVASVVSRVAVMLLLLVGGTGVMRLAPYDPSLTDLLSYLLDEALAMAIYLLIVFTVLSRIFGGRPFWHYLLMTAGLAAVQFVFNLVWPVASNPIWVIYALLAARLLGLDHPVAADDRPLGLWQRALGWLAILIFVLCFTPSPVVLV
jgi:membrane-associated protease RseP (regulator of RpoE activity)